ncbi:hypothetical protein CPB84DRAFT_1761343 [Gymnopilus junonius]|uniref:Uncharacterized protein n=1 Tax=Gymnopilus junonius TaxID=109634 RepID=A0A9P5TUU6_GYMJU|nr:hypothetical protein CPB84DRAFT_1761343 [Gymnopilus junonius]
MSDPMAEPSVAPTHILALSSSRPPRNTSSPKQVTLYAIHSMVFAANCNSFPLLPFSPASTREGNKTNTVTLPVVHFALPAPDSFIILSTYIYTKSANYLRYELFPPNWASDVQSVVKKALFIHGLWANARAFGVVDTAFWEVIDECWRKVIRALSELTDWKPSA